MNEILIELRKRKKLSQLAAAKAIGISQAMLSYLERGGRHGSDKTKIKVANYYKQPIEYIFFSGKNHKR